MMQITTQARSRASGDRLEVDSEAQATSSQSWGPPMVLAENISEAKTDRTAALLDGTTGHRPQEELAPMLANRNQERSQQHVHGM